MSLLALQQDFRSWLTSEDANVTARSGNHAQAGLAVYLNNYRSQLLACLATSYPALRAWIGAEAFDGAAATHVDRVSPSAWTLDEYGLDFPETLDTIYSAAAEIGELARLERELTLAFVGPDATSVDAAKLGHVDWDRAVLQVAPTVALLPVTTNVGAIWSAINAQQIPPPAVVLPAHACIVIWRQGLTPVFRTTTAVEGAILEQARSGRCFGAICADLVERKGEEQGAKCAGALLSQWLLDGLIAHVSNAPMAACASAPPSA